MTAFTSSDSKKEEALKLGAHKVVNSRDAAQLKAIAGSLNFIVSTVNVTLDWVIIDHRKGKYRSYSLGLLHRRVDQ